MSPIPKRVGLLHVSRVISEVFGDQLTAGGRRAPETFPLQQKVLLCSLLLLARRLRAREVTLGKVSDAGTPSGPHLGSGRVSMSTASLLCVPQLHDTYSQVCRQQRLPAVDQAECLSLVTLLESRGVLELKKAKEARLAKVPRGTRGSRGAGSRSWVLSVSSLPQVSLKMEEAAVEHALQDAVLLGSILAQGLR